MARFVRAALLVIPLVFTPALTIAASPTCCCCQDQVCCDGCTDCCCT